MSVTVDPYVWFSGRIDSWIYLVGGCVECMPAIAEVGRVLFSLLNCIFGQANVIKYLELLVLYLAGDPHQELLQDSLTGLLFKLLTLGKIKVKTLISDFLIHSRDLMLHFFEVLLVGLFFLRLHRLRFLGMVELTPISIGTIKILVKVVAPFCPVICRDVILDLKFMLAMSEGALGSERTFWHLPIPADLGLEFLLEVVLSGDYLSWLYWNNFGG